MPLLSFLVITAVATDRPLPTASHLLGIIKTITSPINTIKIRRRVEIFDERPLWEIASCCSIIQQQKSIVIHFSFSKKESTALFIAGCLRRHTSSIAILTPLFFFVQKIASFTIALGGGRSSFASAGGQSLKCRVHDK